MFVKNVTITVLPFYHCKHCSLIKVGTHPVVRTFKSIDSAAFYVKENIPPIVCMPEGWEYEGRGFCCPKHSSQARGTA